MDNVRNERQAYMLLAQQAESKQDKAKRVMSMQDKSFAFRLAALNAVDSNPGKVWG